MKTIQNQTFDEERALYGAHNVQVIGCCFDGPARISLFKIVFLTCAILFGTTTGWSFVTAK